MEHVGGRMIHRFVFHNDRLLPVAEVRLSPGQAGLLNGWGLFTTVRIYEGIPFAFERHWKRLQRDAERTHCPFPFEENVVRGKLGEVLRANQVREGAARIARARTECGFSFGRSESDFLAGQRLELLRGAAGGTRRGGAAERARRS